MLPYFWDQQGTIKNYTIDEIHESALIEPIWIMRSLSMWLFSLTASPYASSVSGSIPTRQAPWDGYSLSPYLNSKSASTLKAVDLSEPLTQCAQNLLWTAPQSQMWISISANPMLDYFLCLQMNTRQKNSTFGSFLRIAAMLPTKLPFGSMEDQGVLLLLACCKNMVLLSGSRAPELPGKISGVGTGWRTWSVSVRCFNPHLSVGPC